MVTIVTYPEKLHHQTLHCRKAEFRVQHPTGNSSSMRFISGQVWKVYLPASGQLVAALESLLTGVVPTSLVPVPIFYSSGNQVTLERVSNQNASTQFTSMRSYSSTIYSNSSSPSQFPTSLPQMPSFKLALYFLCQTPPKFLSFPSFLCLSVH